MKQSDRSLKTKLAFGNALKKQLLKKPLEAVRITDLAADTDIDRKTFYYHFSDINELFEWMLFHDLQDAGIPELLLKDPEKALLQCADFVVKTRYLRKCLNTPEGNARVKSVISKDIYQFVQGMIDQAETAYKIHIDDDFKQFLIIIYGDAIGEAFTELSKGTLKLSAEAFTSYLINTVTAVIETSVKYSM